MRKILTVNEIIKALYDSDLNELTQDAVYWLDKLQNENKELKRNHSKFQAGIGFGVFIVSLVVIFLVI